MGCRTFLQGNLSNPGIEPASVKSPALAGKFFTASATWEAYFAYETRACAHILFCGDPGTTAHKDAHVPNPRSCERVTSQGSADGIN